MEKILYSANLHGFHSENGELLFMHGEDEVAISYGDVNVLKAESNMSAKTGAYVRITLDTDNASLVLDSDNGEFFDVLFDILCIELDVDMEELFNISAAETKTEKIIYTKKEC